MQRYRETGAVRAAKFGGYKKPILAERRQGARTGCGALGDDDFGVGERTGRAWGQSRAVVGLPFPETLGAYVQKTYGPPRLQGDLPRLPADQSASTYPASRNSFRPRWRYARSGPHRVAESPAPEVSGRGANVRLGGRADRRASRSKTGPPPSLFLLTIAPRVGVCAGHAGD
jgi:hypothetical protein